MEVGKEGGKEMQMGGRTDSSLANPLSNFLAQRLAEGDVAFFEHGVEDLFPY